MPDRLTILLDQNVPQAVVSWLKLLRPTWAVFHTGEVGLSGKADEEVFAWAQQQSAVVVTFDEDFADGRSFPAQRHHGIVRLRVWPTTIEETEQALGRLLSEVTEAELTTSLIIVDRSRIRVRTRPQ
ncbi:hypothetical protein FBQ96_01920 [Nitrospirales bacterium NOB]|mgnify:FL=1|nr:hypothetical protein [Nitrospirales bacterium NOB]